MVNTNNINYISSESNVIKMSTQMTPHIQAIQEQSINKDTKKIPTQNYTHILKLVLFNMIT